MNSEMLIRALGDVGEDLLHMAEQRKFANPWKKWGTLAACLALAVSLGALSLPYFPMGCGASSEEPMAQEVGMTDGAEQETVEMPEAAPEESAAAGEVQDAVTEDKLCSLPPCRQEQVQTAVEGEDYQWLMENIAEPLLDGQVDDWTVEKATYAEDFLCLWLLPPEQEEGTVSRQWFLSARVESDGWYLQDFAPVD